MQERLKNINFKIEDSMLNGLLARKVGMTQVFEEDGTALPVTVLQSGPMTVVQKKTL